jgi:hypothetical protein
VINQGHGHVTPRPDGIKARCGGPALCSECAKEKAALEAAGKPTHISLELPASLPSMVYVQDGQAWRRGSRVYVTSNGGGGMPPEDARYLAAALALYADEVDAETRANEPDPAEVKDLAREITENLNRIGGRPTEAAEIAARVALQWMRERQGGQ